LDVAGLKKEGRCVIEDCRKTVAVIWPTNPFITFCQVLRNNSWRSNKNNEKKNKNKKRMNAEDGEEIVQAKPHAYVHR